MSPVSATNWRSSAAPVGPSGPCWRFPTKASTNTQSRPRTPPAPLSANTVREGLVAWLPKNVPMHPVFQKQGHMNPGALGHPVCIVGGRYEGNNHVSCCLQMTSFGGNTVQEKYPNDDNHMRLQYLAIDQRGSTVPHNNTPVLALDRNRSMSKQTYVHLDFFFEIETKYLEEWYSSEKCLDASSFVALQSQFADFIDARKAGPRRTPSPGRPVSPLDLYHYTIQGLGVPDRRRRCLLVFNPTASAFVPPSV